MSQANSRVQGRRDYIIETKDFIWKDIMVFTIKTMKRIKGDFSEIFKYKS